MLQNILHVEPKLQKQQIEYYYFNSKER